MIREIPPVVLGIGGLVGLVLLWLSWRVLVAAGLILAAQWAVITHLDNRTVWLVVLALPALLAGLAVASALGGGTRAHRTPSRKRYVR